MKTDALNRRSRFAKPQPLDTRIEIKDGDLILLQALDRHGQLPVNYLYELTKHRRRNYGYLQHRMTQLYNGCCEHPDHRCKNKDGHVCKPISFVSRDWQQWNNFQARYQHAVYQLAYAGHQLLLEQGIAARPFRRSNSFLHDFFLACFTASVDNRAERFIFRDEILSHPRCPKDARIQFGDTAPDDLFGVQYEDGGFRFFALEIDCATERIRAISDLPASISKKIAVYHNILRTQEYKTLLGLPTLTILFATTNQTRANNMIAAIKETVDPLYHSKFLVKAFDGFSKSSWRVPKEILPVFAPWKNALGEVDISKKASA